MNTRDWSEADWDKLIRGIRQGQVIPIVGERLSRAEVSGVERPLVSLLSEHMAADGLLELDTIGDDLSFAALAEAFIRQGGDMCDLYDSLLNASQQIASTPATSLMQLAEITDFRLFVTLGIDTLLEKALQAARPTENIAHHSYHPGDAQDICPVWPPLQPVVYHLFGRISTLPDYVVSHEDLLEFMHALQSAHSRPRELFARFARCTLLIIGSALTDWLALFFLRMSSELRLSNRISQLILIDAGLQASSELRGFVEQFSKRTRLIDQAPQDFVSELHIRWNAQRGEALMDESDVFISYASEDRAKAEALREGLLAHYPRLGIWLDQQGGLEVGDDFTRKIYKQIRQVRVFLPLISANSVAGDARRFYRQEWNLAEARAIELGNVPFILPVCTDTLLINDGKCNLPATFSKLHWHTLGEGPLSRNFSTKVIETIRAHKKQVAS